MITDERLIECYDALQSGETGLFIQPFELKALLLEVLALREELREAEEFNREMTNLVLLEALR
jgi:hypothetical protein